MLVLFDSSLLGVVVHLRGEGIHQAVLALPGSQEFISTPTVLYSFTYIKQSRIAWPRDAEGMCP